MSWDLVKEAFAAIGGLHDPPAALVLVVLANRANENGEAWPSVASLSADTGMSGRTVKRARADLLDAGLIADTGRRRGATGRVRVFEILPNGANLAPLVVDTGAGNGARSARVMGPNLHGNGAILAPGTSKESPIEAPSAHSRAGEALADRIARRDHDRQTLGRFVKVGDPEYVCPVCEEQVWPGCERHDCCEFS